MALVYLQVDNACAEPPRWWWMGVQQPLNLPPESARGKRQAEIDKNYAAEHCVEHSLSLPCEECPPPIPHEPPVPCGDCGYCEACQSDPAKAYCEKHGLLGKTGECQDCIDKEVYGPFLCSKGHELRGPVDQCGQIFCSPCEVYMNPRDDHDRS